MTDINHLALETFGTRGRPQSKWKGNFYITVDPLLGHSYLAAQFYHVEEPWSATCQHLRSHERIIIVVWEANQKGTRCMGIWKPLMEEAGRGVGERFLGFWQAFRGDFLEKDSREEK